MALGEHIVFDIEKFRLDYNDDDAINIVFSKLDEFEEFIAYMIAKHSIDLSSFIPYAAHEFNSNSNYVVLDGPKRGLMDGIDKEDFIEDDFIKGDYYYSDITFDEILSFNIESSDLMSFLTT